MQPGDINCTWIKVLSFGANSFLCRCAKSSNFTLCAHTCIVPLFLFNLIQPFHIH